MDPTAISDGGFDSKRFKRVIIQLLFILPVTLTSLSEGIADTWSSSAFPKLMSDDGPFKINSDEASWIATLPMLGILCAVPGYLVVMKTVGRKLSLIFSISVQFISWILIIFSTSLEVLYIGVFLRGMGDCFIFSLGPIYIGEVAESKIRGIFGSLAMVTYNIGSLLCSCIGPHVTYQVPAIIGSIVSGLAALTCIYSPESPYYYLMKKKEDKAKEVLKILRVGINVESELKQISEMVERERQEKGSFIDLFRDSVNLKALAIVSGVMVFQQFTGIGSFLAYLQPLFDSADGVLSGADSGPVFTTVKLFSSFISFSLIDLIGRKPILIFSSITTACVLAVLGGYFYVKDILVDDVSQFSWLPTAVLVAYAITYTTGFNTIPFVLRSEMFSTKFKVWGLILTKVVFGIFAFGSIKMFTVLKDSEGAYLPLWIFAGFTGGSALFFWCVLSETKGKTLEAIQVEMRTKQ